MTLESRIRDQLTTELIQIPELSGSISGVLDRGKRRRLTYRVAQGLAVAAAVILAVATTALIVNVVVDAEPEPAAMLPSPFTGSELVALSDDPLVLRGEPGPQPTAEPEGTELRFQPIRALAPVEEHILGLDLASLTGNAVHAGVPFTSVALGEIDGQRFYAGEFTTPGTDSSPQLIVIAIDPANESFTSWLPEGQGKIRAADESAVWLAAPAAPEFVIVENVSPQTSFVELSTAGESLWQVPVDGVAIIGFEAPIEGMDLINLWDHEQANTTQYLVSFENGEGIVNPPPSVVIDWQNSTGLMASAPEWTDRLNQACTEGVWDLEVASRLAFDFISEDMARPDQPNRALLNPDLTLGATSLWRMSTYYCREAFPPGEIENGPFGGATIQSP